MREIDPADVLIGLRQSREGSHNRSCSYAGGLADCCDEPNCTQGTDGPHHTRNRSAPSCPTVYRRDFRRPTGYQSSARKASSVLSYPMRREALCRSAAGDLVLSHSRLDGLVSMGRVDCSCRRQPTLDAGEKGPDARLRGVKANAPGLDPKHSVKSPGQLSNGATRAAFRSNVAASVIRLRAPPRVMRARRSTLGRWSRCSGTY